MNKILLLLPEAERTGEDFRTILDIVNSDVRLFTYKSYWQDWGYIKYCIQYEHEIFFDDFLLDELKRLKIKTIKTNTQKIKDAVVYFQLFETLEGFEWTGI